jgi:hypothetical protein
MTRKKTATETRETERFPRVVLESHGSLETTWLMIDSAVPQGHRERHSASIKTVTDDKPGKLLIVNLVVWWRQP